MGIVWTMFVMLQKQFLLQNHNNCDHADAHELVKFSIYRSLVCTCSRFVMVSPVLVLLIVFLALFANPPPVLLWLFFVATVETTRSEIEIS